MNTLEHPASLNKNTRREKKMRAGWLRKRARAISMNGVSSKKALRSLVMFNTVPESRWDGMGGVAYQRVPAATRSMEQRHHPRVLCPMFRSREEEKGDC